MIAGLENGFTWLLNRSWQAGVLVLCVLLVQALFRRRLTSRWRFALWWIMLARLVLPFGPESPLSLYNWFRPAPPAVAQLQPASVPVAVPTQARSADQRGVTDVAPFATAANPEVVTTKSLRPTTTSPLPAAGERVAAKPKRNSSAWIFPSLIGLWLLGVIGLAAGVFIQLFRLKRQLEQSASLSDAAVVTLLANCQRELGIRRRIELFSTAAVKSPALFGLIRLRLLLPRGLTATFDALELRYIFLHELAHVRRRDPWLNSLVTALQILHWFNPLLWFGFARLRADRELACDEIALQQTGAAAADGYGATIIKLLEDLNRPAAIPGLVGILEDKQQIRRRITRIARFKQPSRWSALAALLILSLGLVTLTDARPASAPDLRPNLTDTVTPHNGKPLPATVTIRKRPNHVISGASRDGLRRRATVGLVTSTHRAQTGTVVEWGGKRLPLIPPGTRITAIAADRFDGLGITAERTVVAWGANGMGGSTVPAGLTNVVAIAAGGGHSLALKADGRVVAWGAGSIYRPSDPVDCGQSIVPAGLSNVIAIAAGDSHSLAVKSDGTVVAWGAGLVRNPNSMADFGQSIVPAGLSNVVAVAAGARHSLALKSDGTVVGWGKNDFGQCTPPAGLTNVIAIGANDDQSLALKSDGTVVAWGTDGYQPNQFPADLHHVVAIAAGDSHNLALKSDGTVVAWGSDFYGLSNVPAHLKHVIAIAAGNLHSLALQADGTVVAWGANSNGQCTVPPGLNHVIAIAAGAQHSLALRSDGMVVAWGDNAHGQSAVPAGLGDVVAIAAGNNHSLALRANGKVVAWGDNAQHQCAVPPDLGRVTAVSGKWDHSLALQADGRVVAWGSNKEGECTVPAGLSHVVAIAAGVNYSLALKSDGTVVAWGYDYDGECDVPAGLRNVIAIGAGWDSSLALVATPANARDYLTPRQVPKAKFEK